MGRRIIAKILCFGLSLGLLIGMTEVSFAAGAETTTEAEVTTETETTTDAEVTTEGTTGTESEYEADSIDESATKDLYRLDNLETYSQFTNYVDGYSLFVDQGMKVDMRYSGVCAVLENEHKRIEIYKENGNVGRRAYINYSNQFIANTADHTKEYEFETTINGKDVHILQWSRQKLSRVENDKNYYVSLEILSGTGEIYTIFVKSDEPLYLSGGYHYLVNDFNTFAPTQAAYMKKAKQVSVKNRGWNQETSDFYQQYFVQANTLTWGLFEPTAPDDFREMKYFEEVMEYEFPILLNYTNFENKSRHPNLEYRLQNAYAQKKTLELTLQTSWTGAGEGNMVYDVLDGEYDEFLRNYAETVSEFDHPVLFRLGNEMNGDWCPYSSYNTSKDTLIFKEFYRYIYQIFEEANADNVIWIWNPNGKSFPDFQWNDALMYYPGDQYVDIVGLTAYNTGTYYPGENWTEFDQLYDPIYEEYTRLYQHPMMITEFASSSVGGDKNQWIKNMFNHIGKYQNIKVAVWWNGCDRDANGNVARPYFINETSEIIQTFREYLSKKSIFSDALG